MILIVPVVLIQIVTGYVFFDRHWNRMIQRLSDATAGEIALLIETIEDQDPNTPMEPLVLNAIRNFEMLLIWKPEEKLTNTDIQASAGWERMVADIFVPALKRKINYDFALNLDFEEKWVYLDVQLPKGVVQITLPERRIFSSSGYIYLLWVFASALVLLLISILFMRNQVRPIRKLAIAANKLGRGQDVGRFKPEGAREVRQAGVAFLEMARRVKKQMEQRAMMLAGVSHDLRTPVTRLKLELSMIANSHDVEPMLSDLKEMEQMISGYLEFIRDEEDEKSIRTAMDSFVFGVVEILKRDGSEIYLDMDTRLYLSIKPQALTRCLSNIIGNAQKYGTKIWVSGEKQGDEYLHLVIEDNGPGVSMIKQKMSLNRFSEATMRAHRGRAVLV